MNDALNGTHGGTNFEPGTRVLTPDGPGSVVEHIDAETIAVGIDGEGPRIDHWHPSQVEIDLTANLIKPNGHHASALECTDCWSTGRIGDSDCGCHGGVPWCHWCPAPAVEELTVTDDQGENPRQRMACSDCVIAETKRAARITAERARECSWHEQEAA
jgi:hypothetical protein